MNNKMTIQLVVVTFDFIKRYQKIIFGNRILISRPILLKTTYEVFFFKYHFYRKNLVIKMHLKLICPKIYIGAGGVFLARGVKNGKNGCFVKKV